MPKYDSKTIDRILQDIRMMQIACSFSEEQIKKMNMWDDFMEDYQDGMLDAWSIVIDLLIEMKNTAKAKNEKA